MSRTVVRLGTRGSRLSLRQTELIAGALRRHAPHLTLEVVIIKTAGDRAPDVPLERLEGIGFFAKELEAALVDRRCDLAVHSAKDLPTRLHPELMLGAICMRTEPRDVLVAASGLRLFTLPPGARVATSSVRRIAQLRYHRPDLVPVAIRGNIDTRFKKLDQGQCDALCLAGAGLVRMGWQDRVTEWLEPDVMLPAPGQGALAVEVRRGDADLIDLLHPLDHAPTREAVEAERAFVARVGSGCRAPAGALAISDGKTITLEAMVAREDGSALYRQRASGPVGASKWLGMSIADHLMTRTRPSGGGVMTASGTRGSLAGRRIVVTRSRAQAQALCARLEMEGAEVIAFPTIRLGPPADYGPLDRAIAAVEQYRWIVFTSQNGVVAFLDRMRALGRDLGALRGARLAAIGPGTARAVREGGLSVDLAPAEFRAEALVEAFARVDLAGARVLLPRAEAARTVLPDGLRGFGAIVDVVAVYRTEMESEHDSGARSRLLDGPVDAVTFTSSSTVRNFMALLGPEAVRILGRCVVACIGPVTAATAREHGLEVGLVAETYTIPGLVGALRAAFAAAGRAGGPVAVSDGKEEGA